MFEQKDNSETQISIFNREKKKEKGKGGLARGKWPKVG